MPKNKEEVKQDLQKKHAYDLIRIQSESRERIDAINDIQANAVDFIKNVDYVYDLFNEINDPCKDTEEYKEFFQALQNIHNMKFDEDANELEDKDISPEELVNTFKDFQKKALALNDVLEMAADSEYEFAELDDSVVSYRRDQAVPAEMLSIVSKYITNDKERNKNIQNIEQKAKYPIKSQKLSESLQEQKINLEVIDEIIVEKKYTKDQIENAKETIEFGKDITALTNIASAAERSQEKVYKGSKQFADAKNGLDQYYDYLVQYEELKKSDKLNDNDREEFEKLAEKLVQKADETRELIGKYFKRKDGQLWHNKNDKERIKLMTDALEKINKLDKTVKKNHPILDKEAEFEPGTIEFAQDCIMTMATEFKSPDHNTAVQNRKAIEMHMSDIIAVNLCKKDGVNVNTPDGKSKVSSVSNYVRSTKPYRDMLKKANTPDEFLKLVNKAMTKNGSELMVAYSKEFEASAQKGNVKNNNAPVKDKNLENNNNINNNKIHTELKKK